MSLVTVLLVLGPFIFRHESILSSAEEKPGMCPVEIDFPECKSDLNNSSEKCDGDLDCKERMKCCVYRCGQRCVLPLEDKRNPCPSFHVSGCPASHPTSSNECHKDEQCPGAERCCCSDCVRKCTPTVKEKHGQCPATRLKCPNHAPPGNCEQDEDCYGKDKCCNMCGKLCMKPSKEHSGFCPVSSDPAFCSAPIQYFNCTLDADCAENQKCCLYNNQMTCVNSVEVKSGDCPASVAKCAFPGPRPLCKSDKDCPGAKKCCMPVCKKICTDPITDKPGECPVVNTLVPCATPYPPPRCEKDLQCPGSQKCCDYACRQQCADPFNLGTVQ